MTFDTVKDLKNYLYNLYCRSESPEDLESKLNEFADTIYVKGDDEPYSAVDLAELV